LANFDTFITKSNSARQALGMLVLVRSIYESGKQVQAALTAYQAGTDAAFVASVNALFTAGERTELAAIGTAISTLVTDLETNHMGAIIGGN